MKNKRKGKDVNIPVYVGEESLLQTCGRAQASEAGTSERVINGHDQTEMNHVIEVGGEPDAAARRLKVQKGQVTKMSGLYWKEPLEEGQPRPWPGEFRVKGKVCKPYLVKGRD